MEMNCCAAAATLVQVVYILRNEREAIDLLFHRRDHQVGGWRRHRLFGSLSRRNFTHE
jgi:hypothetical protein